MKALNFCETWGISMRSERVLENPTMLGASPDWQADHYRVTFKRREGSKVKQFSAYFSKGIGHKGKSPTRQEVLGCLAMDFASIEDSRNFEDWCAELGYDNDSRRAEKTYLNLQDQAARMREFLGSDNAYRQLLAVQDE